MPDPEIPVTLESVQAAQRRSCRVCRDWADVIHGDYDGRREEHWHSWPEPDHACPACGREPEVLVIRFAFDPGEDAPYEHVPQPDVTR